MQLVLGYKPLQIGLAFLPANIIMAIFSIGVSARLVVHFGIKKPLAGGLFLAAIGLAILARAPVAGNYLVDILPSMILLGFGAGAALNPMLLAAMDDLSSEQSGLASGLVNTSFMMGGALGLAILASIAAALTGGLLASGAQSIVALTGGYHAAFLTGAIFALSASLLGAFVLRINRPKAGSPAQ